KRGGAAWLGGGAKAGGFSGATGGSGAIMQALSTALGPTAAAILPRALVAVLLAQLAGSAWVLGKAASSAQSSGKKEKAHKAFEMPLPKVREASKNAETGGDSLAMISGSTDGRTP